MTGTVQARDLGKKYKRYDGPWRRLGEWLSGGRRRMHEEHWALRHLTFDVGQGETVGIVGQNGAGKSTLLKLIVGTTQPSEGTFAVGGRATALLELGMGFHPDFNGRQNALMTLRMAGFSEEESEAILPEVVEFSELGGFMEQPLRTYSSGMQVRLGFAIATARRPDILIVDEALSVGDAYFQHKCIRRIRDFKEEGTTMLFVSHDPIAVKSLCDRAILLDHGRMIQQGSAEAVLDYYNAMIAEREQHDKAVRQEAAGEQEERVRTESGSGEVRITRVSMTNGEGMETTSFTTGERTVVTCELEFRDELHDYAVGILLRDRLGNEVYGINTTYLGVSAIPAMPGDKVEAHFSVDLNLGYGHYAISVAAHSPDGHVDANYHWLDNAIAFQVIPGDSARFAGVAALPARGSFRRSR